MVDRKRERIGLSLAADVMDILRIRGRSELPCRTCETLPPYDPCPKCGNRPGDRRPTRTQIIEAAVRQWAGHREFEEFRPGPGEVATDWAGPAVEKPAVVTARRPARISNAGAETNIPVRPFQSFPKPPKGSK